MNRIQAAEPRTGPSDGALLRRFAEGRDDAAFAELVARHGPMVLGVCRRTLGHCQDAEDVFQAVFLALAKHAGGLARRETLGPWLYTVARRLSLNAAKSRKRRRWVFWGKTPEPATAPREEASVDLDAALAALSEPERSAVVLCHLEGLSRTEAAHALAIPEGTLSARLSRALEKLRRKLGKPPLAILGAAAVVILPDSLPAATLGLVRHFRDGALEDWASPRILHHYRKATSMRLLDRLAPPLAAALLIMLGALFGWQLLSAQRPPGETKQQPPQVAAAPRGTKKSFAAMVEEMQSARGNATANAKSLAQLRITRVPQKSAQSLPWQITVMETVDGAKVDHVATSWPALEPLLRQIASTHKSLQVLLEPNAVNRLEANQVVNLARSVGFKSLDYRGPPLFEGRNGESHDARADVTDLQFAAVNLTDAAPPLPDWTNGWMVADAQIVRLDDDPTNVTWTRVGNAVLSINGPLGPAAVLEIAYAKVLASENAGTPFAGKKTKDLLAQAVVERSDAAAAASVRRIVSLARSRIGDQTQVMMDQQFPSGLIASKTEIAAAGALIVERAAKAAGGGRFDVRVGPTEALQPETSSGTTVNPLHVNHVLNALKRGGAVEIHYVGQQLFTGQRDYSPEAPPIEHQPRPVVQLILQPDQLDGELPDDSNGWINNGYILKAADLQMWTDRRNARMPGIPTGENPSAYDAEIARLAKLPPDELEKEIVKKDRLLQHRFRKAVEDAKTKKQ